MAFVGTIVARGRGSGVVVAIAAATELGRIAASLDSRDRGRPPLLLRMERFTRVIGFAVGLVVLALSAVQLMRGIALAGVFHARRRATSRCYSWCCSRTCSWATRARSSI